MIDFEQETKRIEGLLKEKHYTIAAKECVELIEHALEYLFKQHLTDLSEADRLKVQEAEFRLGDKGKKGVERFTMGGIVLLFRETNFFDALSRTLKIDISGLEVIDLNKIRELRNKFIHERRKANRAEARLLFSCLQIILETFEIVTSEKIEILSESVDMQTINQHKIVNKLSPKGSKRLPDRIEEPQQVDEQIKFVNRVNEVRYITELYCPPYLLITAPMGYGKTRLLEVVKTQLQGQNWLCISIRLSRKTSSSICDISKKILEQLGYQNIQALDLKTAERCGEEVGKGLLRALEGVPKNILLMIDEIEAVDDDVAKQLLNQLVIVLKDMLKRDVVGRACQFRLILAGRYISHWKSLDSQIPMELLSLTPFDFSAISQVVENVAAKDPSSSTSEFRQIFAAHLMYVTAGHPACMTKILKEDFGRSLIVIEKNTQKYYEDIVAPVIQEMQEYIPHELQSILSTLSVVRRFNSLMLRYFLERKLIDWGKRGHIDKLGEQKLLSDLPLKIVEFLTSMPNMYDSHALRALLYNAGLDTQLQNNLNFALPPAQFFPLLVPTLSNYGTLEDGRNALKAVLEATKNYVGQEKKAYCDTLIQELDRCLQNPEYVPPQPVDTFERRAHELERHLLKTYLINKKDGFLQDGISRRLLAIELRKNHLAHFIKVCEAAMEFYTTRLEDVAACRADIIANELCFQKLQYLVYREEVDKEKFFQYIRDILDLLVSGRDSYEIMDGFIELLENDWEFRFMLNYLLCGKHLYDDHPYHEFLQMITDFRYKQGDYNA